MPSQNIISNLERKFRRTKKDKTFLQRIKETPFWKDMNWKYKSPAGYLSWKELVSYISGSSTYDHLVLTYRAQDTNSLEFNVGLQVSLFSDAPAVYLRKELGEALLATDVEAMEPPNKVLDALFVMLPNGLLKGDEGEPIDCLLIINEELFTSAMLGAQELVLGKKVGLESKGEGLRVFGIDARRTGTLFQSAAPWSQATYVKSPSCDDKYAYITDYSAFREVTKKMMRIAKNIILLYNYERHLVKEEPCLSFVSARERKSSDKRPFPTTWLGSDFKVKRAVDQCGNSSDNSDRSVRAHWRKGHWHRYWCGEGREKQVTRWVQPVYVGKFTQDL